jgi:hypothetical protein
MSLLAAVPIDRPDALARAEKVISVTSPTPSPAPVPCQQETVSEQT